MSGEHPPTCNSEVELATLAPGMAKQHERYQDALQELIDNAVSSVVKSESYFENPKDSVEIVIKLHRKKRTVRTTIADNGPGIPRDTLRDNVFRTGSKEASDGILNNVGWGLKASLAWFEETLSQLTNPPNNPWFTLITSTEETIPYRVDGPITGDLPISDAGNEDWAAGLEIGNHQVAESGTRVHVSCSRSKFDNDVWPSAKSLEIKAQTLRELLGVKFRRFLDAHQKNSIHIDYLDETTGNQGSLPVVPIHPKYVDNDKSPPTDYAFDEFVIEPDDETAYTVEFERGTLDFDAMADNLSEDNPGLFTTSGRFRTRYRPSQSRQGVDIYANGRILMTSVFTDLFDLTRNNEYNYFGGEIRIIPADKSSQVPTDNKKIRIDSNSKLWHELQEKLSQEDYQPQGKRYDSSNKQETSSGSTPANETVEPGNLESVTVDHSGEIIPASSETDNNLFALHQKDSASLKKTLLSCSDILNSGQFVDVTITSPPYFDMKDYGYTKEDQIGQQESYSEYLEELREIFSQVYDVTKESGTLWVVVDSFKMDRELVQLQHDIATVCQNLSGKQLCDECGGPLEYNRTTHTLSCSADDCDFIYNRKQDSWLLQEVIVWNKTRGLPYNNDGRLRNVFEYILCFSKSEQFTFDVDSIRIPNPEKFEKWWVSYPERYHPRGKLPSNIWEYITPSQGAFGGLESLDHPAPFPPRLVERILRLTTTADSIVLDPFAGSGMTLAVADIMERQPIGFELSPDYCSAYPDVRQEVEEKFGNRLNASQNLEQINLTKTIGRLRQVKQVRELLRKYMNSSEYSSSHDLSVHTAFHFNRNINPSAVDRGIFMNSDIHYVVDKNMAIEDKSVLQNGLQSIATDELNHSYGVNATVNIQSTDEFMNSIVSSTDKDSTFYIYEDSNHNSFADTITLQEWVQQTVGTDNWRRSYGHKNWPPIVSNIKIDVRNPHRGTGSKSRTESSPSTLQSDASCEDTSGKTPSDVDHPKKHPRPDD